MTCWYVRLSWLHLQVRMLADRSIVEIFIGGGGGEGSEGGDAGILAYTARVYPPTPTSGGGGGVAVSVERKGQQAATLGGERASVTTVWEMNDPKPDAELEALAAEAARNTEVPW